MLRIKVDMEAARIEAEGKGSPRDLAIELSGAAHHIYQGLKGSGTQGTAREFLERLRLLIMSDELMEMPLNGGSLTVVVEQRGEHT